MKGFPTFGVIKCKLQLNFNVVLHANNSFMQFEVFIKFYMNLITKGFKWKENN